MDGVAWMVQGDWLIGQ